jgi:hypothetical protein
MSLNKEPNASFEAQQFALALQEYIEAAHAERKGREQFEGYSWDHYGRSLIERRDSAADAFAQKMNAYVDSRITAALSNLNFGPKK